MTALIKIFEISFKEFICIHLDGNFLWTIFIGFPVNIALKEGAADIHMTLASLEFTYILKKLMEAAVIDGAGYWRTFIQIILPQTTGLTGTLWILGFIGMWNNFETTFVFLPSYQTIATGIKYIGDNITSGEYALDYPKYFAAILLTTLPRVVLFLIFQKRIMQLSLGGGIKG